jgi:IS30 family transposase
VRIVSSVFQDVEINEQIPHSNINAPPIDPFKTPINCPLGQIQRGLANMRGQSLTLYERQKIEFHLRGKETLRGISRMLHRDHSVLVRELQRNICRDGAYRAAKAQEYAEKRKSKKRKRKLEEDEELQGYVLRQIIDEQWSPEQISGEIKKRLEPWMSGKGISHETIYQFIYEGQGRFLGLYQYLRRGRKKRQRRFSRKHRRNQPISFITPIQYRPMEINEKKEFGHWESDTTVCENKGEAVSAQYERSTQLCRLTKVIDKGAEATEGVLRDLVESIPVKSITFDRGSEGGNHYKLRLNYGIDTYHCDPYSSWQKGGVENLNGLIRQYLPRGIDLSQISHHEIYVIQEKLNNRPRKNLGYKSPNQCLQGLRESGVVH